MSILCTLPPELWMKIISEFGVCSFSNFNTIKSIPSKNSNYIVEAVTILIQECIDYISHLLYNMKCNYITNKSHTFNKYILFEIYKFLTNNMTIEPFFVLEKQHTNIIIKSQYSNIYYNMNYLCYYIEHKMKTIVIWYDNGNLESINKYIYNELGFLNSHSIDGPSKIEWSDTGVKLYEEYSIDNNLHRKDGPAKIKWNEKGVKIYEDYYIDNKLHRIDNPASIYYNDDGNKYMSIYYINNKKHRIDGPAKICYDIYGFIKSEEYYIDNILDRIDGPAKIEWYVPDAIFSQTDTQPYSYVNDKKGVIKTEEYYINGQFNQINGPTRIEWHENGIKQREVYIIDYYYYSPRYHRDNGPAIIEWDVEGNLITEMYYVKNNLHRTDGPAIIRFTKSGDIIKKYYNYGKEVL